MDDFKTHVHTEEKHNGHICKVMEMVQEYGLVFNLRKYTMKATSIKSFGCIYDIDGVHPYPTKCSTIHTIKAPENDTQLWEFLDMITYLGPFMANVSTHTTPLHKCLKGNEFTWNRTYDTTFHKLKSLLCNETTLRYFDITSPIVIKVNTSKVSLSATLLQDEQPVAFVSKALHAKNRYM